MPNTSTATSLRDHRLLRFHRPRLLVVEDDPSMWKLIERAARDANPDVVIHWATDADGARLALERYRFDAILADYLLENSIDGYSVLGEARRRQPRARIGMASALPLRPPGDNGCPFLRKPFEFAECREFVAQLLL
jgi:DNA-binding response OmpR family regulator